MTRRCRAGREAPLVVCPAGATTAYLEWPAAGRPLYGSTGFCGVERRTYVT